MSDTITFKCTKCGAPAMIDESREWADEDVVSCTSCGAVFGTIAEVRAVMVEAGERALRETIKKANLPSWIKPKS